MLPEQSKAFIQHALSQAKGFLAITNADPSGVQTPHYRILTETNGGGTSGLLPVPDVNTDNCAAVNCAAGLQRKVKFFAGERGCEMNSCSSRECCIAYREMGGYVFVATILLCSLIYGTWKLENKKRKFGSIRSWLHLGPIAWIEDRAGSLLLAWYRLKIWLRKQTDCMLQKCRKRKTRISKRFHSGQVRDHIDTTRMCQPTDPCAEGGLVDGEAKSNPMSSGSNDVEAGDFVVCTKCDDDEVSDHHPRERATSDEGSEHLSYTECDEGSDDLFSPRPALRSLSLPSCGGVGLNKSRRSSSYVECDEESAEKKAQMVIL